MILGFSTEENSSLKGDTALEYYVPVAETFLQRLFHKCPQVFNLDEGGPVISSMNNTQHIVGDIKHGSSGQNLGTGKPGESVKQAEAKTLLQMLPSALSVVLFPLWDSHRGCRRGQCTLGTVPLGSGAWFKLPSRSLLKIMLTRVPPAVGGISKCDQSFEASNLSNGEVVNGSSVDGSTWVGLGRGVR